MSVQLLIFKKAYSISVKKEAETNLALYFVIFNPISLLGGFLNLSAFNDFLWHLLILAPLTNSILNDRFILSILAVVVAYFSPGIIFCLIPLTVLQARLNVPDGQQGEPRKHDTFKRLILLAGLIYIMLLLICSKQQMTNFFNILYVNNKSETVGSFWYVMVEMFSDKVVFFKKLYLLMQLLMCSFICILLH